ncbi:hypothetical protein AAC387_Pa06g1412 [Persea americana]
MEGTNVGAGDRVCFVQALRDKKLLRDTRQVSVEEVVAEFMHTIAHSVRNRINSFRFFRYGETISRHFQEVLYAINRLAHDYFVQAGPHTPKGPYRFEDCIGALDGTHVPIHVPTEIHGAFQNRQGVLSQNVLGACGFDMNFHYVLPGWEGSATDARVLQNAFLGEDPLIVPQGKYYLVDAGYANAPGFLAPYRAVRYHLNEFRGMNPQNEKELFNKRHSQARNVIERTFGILKNRFCILKTAVQYVYKDQVSIVVACCVMHNFIRANCVDSVYRLDNNLEDQDEINMGSTEYDNDPSEDTAVACGTHSRPHLLYSQSEREDWHRFRDGIARRQYARSTTTAPSHQSTEPGAANFSPLQVDSDMGLTDRLRACKIQSSSMATTSRRTNPRKRKSDLLEIIHCIERSSEGLKTAISDVADTIWLPKRQHSGLILTELRGIPTLSGLDVELAHEWLTVHADMAIVFITADNKDEWILRQIPRIC